MFSNSRRRMFVLALAVVSAAGCKDLTDAVTPLSTGGGGGGGGGTATVTFWTSDSSPSSIAVSVDGTQVGVLSLYRTGPPACGSTTTGGTLTVAVTPGTHVMSAREITDTGKWGPANFTVASGGCMTYALNP